MAPIGKRKPFKIKPIKLGGSGMQPINLSSLKTLPPPPPSSNDNDDGGPFDALIGAGKIGLDILQAPSRAVGGLISEVKDDGFQVLDIPRGIAKLGDEDYDPSDVLETDGFWSSLAVDIGLDPLTYLSGGLVGVGKGAVKGTAKGISKGLADDAADTGKAIDRGNLGKRLKTEARSKRDTEKAKLKSLEKDMKFKRDLFDRAPKTKNERVKIRKEADDLIDRSSLLRKDASAKRRSIQPSFLDRTKTRLREIDEVELPTSRLKATEAAVTASQAGTKVIDDIAASAGRSTDQISKDLTRVQKEITKKEQTRNKTKAGSKERGAANQEIYELRSQRKQYEQELRANTNEKTLRKQAREQIEADEAIKAGDEAFENAVTDAATGARVPSVEEFAFAAKAADNVSPRLAKQRASQASARVTKLEGERAELQGRLPGSEQVRQVEDEIVQATEEAEDLMRQAENLRTTADTDVTQLANDIEGLEEAASSSRQVIEKLDQQLNILENSDTLEEFLAAQKRIMEIVDTPAMRDLAPDVVQRQIKFAPFGVHIPGLSDALKAPLGKAYSKSARRAAFDERFPALAKVRNQLGETFNPIYGISPLLADLERGRANLAKAGSDRAIAVAQDFRNTVSREERSLINRMLVQADELQLDLADDATRTAGREGEDLVKARADAESALARSANNPVEAAKRAVDNAPKGKKGIAKKRLQEARRMEKQAKQAEKLLEQANRAQTERLALLDEFNNLSEQGKEAVEFVLQTYRQDAHIDFALGFIENIREGYSARLRNLEGDTAPIVTRVNDSALYQERGFAKQRKRGVPDEEIDFLEAFSLRQMQASQMRQGYAMINSLSNEVGRIFPDKAAADAADFARPSKGKVEEWLGSDVYIPKEIADSLDRIHEIWSSPRALNSFTRKWSQLNGMFKNLAYTVNLGHLTIDSIGDSWNMWLAKVPIFNPRYMNASIKAMKDIEFYERAVRRGDIPKKTTVRFADGKDYEISDILVMLDSKGLRNRGRSVGRSGQLDNEADDYFFGDPRLFGRGNPRRVMRAGSDVIQKTGNIRDNTFRSYGMIAQLQKNIDEGMEFSLALNASGNTIRFSTFDYNDLTSVEKRIFRNMMPFYTWTRKNIPYQLNRLMEVPGRVVLPFNVQEAALDREGAPDRSLMQPFTRNTNFLLPESISGLLPGMDNASMFVNPMIPSMDLGRFQTFRIDGEEDLVPGVDVTEPIGMLSPYLKAVPELGMNREFFSGREIGSSPSYVLRTFFGQPGGQVVRQLSPNTSNYSEDAPFGLRNNQFLGLTGQFLGLRGYALEEGPASAARAARLQSIQMRKSAKEEARREAGNLFSLPLIGTDVPNPFYY
jgi:hypothetical protein